MSVLQKILERKGRQECPLPLWKLKITEQDYEDLRVSLRDIALSRSYHFSNPFLKVATDCTLFFAEYWRREYCDGPHSKQMVYEALQTGYYSEEESDFFYDAAVRGAKKLNIEQYMGGRSDPLNDMLYQGGLPMKLVTGNEYNSVWDRFTRGLVLRHVDFDELNLGIIAQQSNSLKEYCAKLIQGIETERFEFMPFYCKNKNDGWFLFLINLAKEVKRKHRQAHPFSLDWEFEIDFVERKISTKYIVHGMQRLPLIFLNDNNLTNKRFFTVQVLKNGNVIDTFDYVNNFCRYNVVSKHPYNHEDVISVHIDNLPEAHISSSVDMTAPHLLYRNKEGKYVLGNHIGSDKSLILFSPSWNIINPDYFKILDFNWGKTGITQVLKAVEINENFSGEVILTSKDGEIKFSKDITACWTDLKSSPLYLPNIVGQLYDANNCQFQLSFDTDSGIKSVDTNRIQFRNKFQSVWSDKPSYGEIFARAIDNTGNYVNPTRLINVGSGLSIRVISADNDSCEIQIKWPHGRVTSNEGQKKANDIWEFQKVNCSEKYHLKFTLIPDDNALNQFPLIVKAPFKEFSIIDINGDEVLSGSYIPFNDIDKYLYHLYGQNIREMKFGNISQHLKWYSDGLNIVSNSSRKQIPFEGSLLTLFGSREQLRYMLDWTSQNHLNAEIKVSFKTDNGRLLELTIKDFPFRPRQIGSEVIMTNINGNPIIFNGALKLICIENPSTPPIIIKKNEDNNCYHLPYEIKDWGKTLVYGRSRGRVSPGMVDLSHEWELNERRENYQKSISNTQEQLSSSKLGDKLWKRIITWFERAQKDDIPASSLTDLVATARSTQSLLFLAFQLYAKCSSDEERENLVEQLKSFSSDLAFSWYWMRPVLDNIMFQLHDFIGTTDSDEFKNIYINWAIQQKEQASSYLLAINNEKLYFSYAILCITSITNAFKQWMIDLCISSLLESYVIVEEPSLAEVSKNILGEERKLYKVEEDENKQPRIKAQRSEESGDEYFKFLSAKNKPLNERKLYTRINAVVAQLQERSDLIDLFSLPEIARRSIIFYCKANNERFIYGLNNLLYNNLYEV